MITNLHSRTKISRKNQVYQITFGQDALFYGREYLNSLLENPSSLINWYVKDGDYILKDQICMEIIYSEEDLQEKIKTLSYLSGISTLSYCYKAASHSIPIGGYPIKDSPLLDWEIKSLELGGVRPQPCPEKICFSEQDLNLEDSVFALSSEMPRDQLQDILTKIPSHKTKGLYGSILPKDLEKIQMLALDIVWPKFLEGYFPSVKFNIQPYE
ncbi:MAG: hypothetical protein ACR2M7_03150 [Bdellovibrionales bacterium]